MKMVVVSPHLDDAVLCAGGCMAIARSCGLEVCVVTVFAGIAPVGGLSELARDFHRECGLEDDVAVAVRRREDQIAAAMLDVRPCWLDLPDAIYRSGESGSSYDSADKLFGTTADSDARLCDVVEGLLRPHIDAADAVLLPLSVGGHVDHVLTRRAGEAAVRRAATHLVGYFEESMYEDQKGALAWTGVDTVGLGQLVISLPPQRRTVKESAVCAYSSQLAMLGVGLDRLDERNRFLARLGVERLWQPVIVLPREIRSANFRPRHLTIPS